jgi:hypothetical protein
MLPCVRLYVVPGTKLMRVAFEILGAAGDGAEVEVETERVGLGRGAEVVCVGLAKGVTACRVPAIAVEVASAEGSDTIEPPQAMLTKTSRVMVIRKTCDLTGFIFLLTIVLSISRIQTLRFCLPLTIQSDSW